MYTGDGDYLSWCFQEYKAAQAIKPSDFPERERYRSGWIEIYLNNELVHTTRKQLQQLQLFGEQP
tara:strand:- start:7872 stop:8066 length:195 start_codon:yes stop_codon:yes gene_type:complete